MAKPVIIVSYEHCTLFHSILNDFGDGRRMFTLEDLWKALNKLGFALLRRNAIVPPRRIGRKAFLLTKDGRMDDMVTSQAQDELKIVLYRLYGWTAETFRCRHALHAHIH